MGILRQIARRFAVLEEARRGAPSGRPQPGPGLLSKRNKQNASFALEEAMENALGGVLSIRITFLPCSCFETAPGGQRKNVVDGYYLASDEEAMYIVVFEHAQVCSVKMQASSTYIFEFNELESIQVLRGA